jgi:hypothetical protein
MMSDYLALDPEYLREVVTMLCGQDGAAQTTCIGISVGEINAVLSISIMANLLKNVYQG